jgi:hypothetical protein
MTAILPQLLHVTRGFETIIIFVSVVKHTQLLMV